MPLAGGDSVNLQFALGVVQGGTFRIYINIETVNLIPAAPPALTRRR